MAPEVPTLVFGCLWLAFARRYGVGRDGSVMFAASAAHRTMAKNLGLRVVEAS